MPKPTISYQEFKDKHNFVGRYQHEANCTKLSNSTCNCGLDELWKVREKAFASVLQSDLIAAKITW